MTFSGMPGALFPGQAGSADAFAQSAAIVRISDAGPGARKSLKLGLNKALVVDLPTDAHDILVADPAKADAVTRTSRRIYLFGKDIGQTNIFIFGPNGEEIVSIDLQVERDIQGLETYLRRFIPDSNIQVEILSDNIVLSGTVRTPQDSVQASRLAQIFLTGGEATTRTVTAQGSNGDAAIFGEQRQESQVVNMLTIEGEDQVTLKVTVAEIRREVLKQLGFDNTFSRIADGSGSSLDVLTVNTASSGLTGNLSANIGKLGIESAINALEQANAIRTLAEPTLTAVSGQAATFNSGGERLFTASDGNGGVTTTTYSYGISLGFTPTVLSSGRISLRIQTKVSEPVASSSGTEFRRRDAETVVELPSGGSIALAGLIRDEVQQNMSGTPIASKLPLFGALFREKSIERNETELVIIATPYLVKPVNRNALSRPDDNFSPAGDVESVFLGRVNKIYGLRDTLPAHQYEGSVGFIYK
ncbi:type II and III secretion system protein family protein [Rhizobium sp. TRM95111]|uniref:type II and III secretion system protein family protein n=1 Tax=Rhizobium alarense TaxID=2846851 RepID=UPI001F3979CA|nr:type II and III secretion system protein family protein [Rhizobium alarense]MCF3642845.1 type II and III secretion system protein family protein [Rhizobium alarense]